MTHVFVPMSTRDQDWIKEYLGQDAATNSQHVQNARFWVVTDDSEVFPADSEDADLTTVDFEEGFCMDVPFDELVTRLTRDGFPQEDYV